MSHLTYFKHRNGDVRRVKSGFNWFALLFGTLWAFANRAWVLGLALFVPTLALTFVGDFVHDHVRGAPGPLIMIALYTVLMYVYGRNGNAWLERSLRSRGYREVRGEAV